MIIGAQRESSCSGASFIAGSLWTDAVLSFGPELQACSLKVSLSHVLESMKHLFKIWTGIILSVKILSAHYLHSSLRWGWMEPSPLVLCP
jgi:hypothetical protein